MAALTDYLSRRGELLVLVLVVVLSVTLMMLSSGRKDDVARALNDAALRPVQVAVNRVTNLNVRRAEADSLRAQLARAELEIAALAESGREAARLRRMLRFRDELGWDVTAARVIGREASTPGPSYKIDRGARDGLREGLAVITPDGLAGKIVVVEPHSAWVRPLVSRGCRVSTRLDRTRVDGILDWSPAKGLHLTFVPPRAEAAVGDVVLTSGLGGTFPRGVRVGEVTASEPNPADGTIRLLIRPAVDFGSLEEVFVVVRAPESTSSEPVRE